MSGVLKYWNGTAWTEVEISAPAGPAGAGAVGWGSPTDSSGTQYRGSPPGVMYTGTALSSNTSAGVVYYVPFVVGVSVTINSYSLWVRLTSTGASVRICVASANSAWQPSSLIDQTAAIPSSSVGLKSANTSAVLSPGRYLLMAKIEDASLNTHTYSMSTVVSALSMSSASLASPGFARFDEPAGAFSDPLPQWTNISTSFGSFVSVRWSLT